MNSQLKRMMEVGLSADDIANTENLGNKRDSSNLGNERPKKNIKRRKKGEQRRRSNWRLENERIPNYGEESNTCDYTNI